MRHLAVLLVLVSVVKIGAQESASKPAPPAFEVASVKTNTSNAGMSMSSPPGRFTVTNMPLRMIIGNAYGDVVLLGQLVGGPAWIDSARFDIAATLPDGAPPEQTMLMLQTLLATRFKLVVHSETRETPIYALVLARNDGRFGPKLKRTTVDCEAIRAARAAGRQGPDAPPPTPPSLDEAPVCSTRMMGRPDAASGGIRLTLGLGGAIMSSLAKSITSYAGRVVVDKTGLDGQFDVVLQFAPPRLLVTNPGATGAVPGDDGPSIFNALEEQLGLKLEPRRGPVEFLVIDSVEQPTPN